MCTNFLSTSEASSSLDNVVCLFHALFSLVLFSFARITYHHGSLSVVVNVLRLFNDREKFLVLFSSFLCARFDAMKREIFLTFLSAAAAGVLLFPVSSLCNEALRRVVSSCIEIHTATRTLIFRVKALTRFKMAWLIDWIAVILNIQTRAYANKYRNTPVLPQNCCKHTLTHL